MASGKEIRGQIKSVQGTQKITRAMEMVAASKMRKAQDRMNATRPYAENIVRVVSHLAHAHPEYSHPFMHQREVKRVGIIVVTTDRGLCGGLNINLFKQVVSAMQQWQQQGVEIDICAIGQKAKGFFCRLRSHVVAEQSHLGDAPKMEQLLGPAKVMLDKFSRGEIDELHLCYNRFVNTMTQSPQLDRLLPISLGDGKKSKELRYHWDYIYEPDPKDVLGDLMTRYVESLIYHGVVENLACEMAARMVAMKAATDNAGNLISELQLAYNKARQAAITQELSEIVSGAAAV
ncbi:F0F1 ATP synthase subunit gamma [Ectothiorhodospiraceae bacterium BW-2]|nr:F0F1 ATP synthase subunit gamma [Ectothiorhodospiraceae bacterium BW-2]